jgi:hypothetical protein
MHLSLCFVPIGSFVSNFTPIQHSKVWLIQIQVMGNIINKQLWAYMWEILMQALGQKMHQPLDSYNFHTSEIRWLYSNLKYGTHYMTIYHLDGTIILLK